MYILLKNRFYKHPAKLLLIFCLFGHMAKAVVPSSPSSNYCDESCDINNKLDNGDFGDTLNHWTADGWIEDSDEAVYSDNGEGYIYQNKTDLFQSNREYKVCFDLYIENHDIECYSVSIKVYFGKNEAGEIITQTYDHDDWDDISYTFKNWSNHDEIKFEIINPNNCNITIKLDNVCVLEIDTFDPCSEWEISQPCSCGPCICWLDEEPEIYGSSVCENTTGSFFVHPYIEYSGYDKLWILTSGSDTIATSIDNVFYHYFTFSGSYNLQVVMNCGTDTADISLLPISITEGSEACLTFSPLFLKEYFISAWVKEDHPSPVTQYTSHIMIFSHYMSSPTLITDAYPSGEIIDGWQRIIAGPFIVPIYEDFEIELVNSAPMGVDAYFDDIRIHPFNGNMKSYVYDTETYWLRSELDENNYATFYEYDEEGKLIRIKKETEKGIFTIQEGRTSGNKKDDE